MHKDIMELYRIRTLCQMISKNRSDLMSNISRCRVYSGVTFSSNYAVLPLFWMSELDPVFPCPSNLVTEGAGRWAIEVADDFPRTRVIGMDLSPMQPTDVPHNCEFVVGDLTETLDDFDDGSFDLIHSR